MKNYLVFDAGGTFTKYALMNENAEILEKDKVPTPDYHTKTKEDYYAVLDSVVEKYKNRIEGIAISMPGMLDNRNGYCVTAGYLAYLAGSTVGTELSQRYGIPVSVENDGKCAALAEFWRGSLKGCTNGAVVVIGTGVAGGIILNGKLFRGIILPQANTAIYAQRRRAGRAGQLLGNDQWCGRTCKDCCKAYRRGLADLRWIEDIRSGK